MAEVKAYSTKLRNKTPVLQEKQRKLIEIVVDIEEEYNKLRIQRERNKVDELEAQAAVDEAAMIKEEA